MAITTVKLFDATELTTAFVAIYVCPTAPTTSCVKNMQVILTNKTAGAVTATLSVGAAGSDSLAFFAAKAIPANDYVVVIVPTLDVGDSLWAKAAAATSIVINEAGGSVFS